MSERKSAREQESVEYVVRTLMGLGHSSSEAEACGATMCTGWRSVSLSIEEEGLYRFLQTTRFGVRVLRPVFRFKPRAPMTCTPRR